MPLHSSSTTCREAAHADRAATAQQDEAADAAENVPVPVHAKTEEAILAPHCH